MHDTGLVTIFYGTDGLYEPFSSSFLFDFIVSFDDVQQTTVFRVFHYDVNTIINGILALGKKMV